MPALKAFGMKWKVGSDDFVYPYVGSVLLRLFWIIIISLTLGSYERQYGDCDTEHLLRAYLIVLITVHCVMIIAEIAIAFVSARGTIANSEPRRHIPYLLYGKMLFFAFEVGWDMVGVVWAFDPSINCKSNNSLLALSRFLLIWNFFFSLIFAMYMILKILCSKGCNPPKKMKYEELKPSTSFGGRRLSRLSSGSLARHAQRRVWQWRLNLMFCCMKLQKYQNSVFTEVSVALADACTNLRGYVPTDVAAGLAIIRLEHNVFNSLNQVESWNELNPTEAKKEVNFGHVATKSHFKKLVHFFRYAYAAYGWRGYCTAGMCNACCVLGKKCKYCCSKPVDGEFRGEADNSCGWNMVSLRKQTNLANSDFVYASFKSEVYLPSFFVAFDHKMKSIVIAIKGLASFSFSDVLTGLGGEPGMITSHGANDLDHLHMFAHKGLSLAARAILLKLGTEAILSKAFALYPKYKLVLTGHSSGAGVAAILAILMKNAYPNMYCYAYSPPGGLLSADAIQFSKPFITTVVLGNDVISRMSLQNIEAVSNKIVNRIQNSDKPKWKIFFDFFLNYTGMRKIRYTINASDESNGQRNLVMDNFDDSFDSFGDDEEEELYDAIEKIENDGTRSYDPVTKKKNIPQVVRENLYLPGKIMHIRYKRQRIWCLFRRKLFAYWTPPSEFSEILIQRNMFNDHSPAALHKAFKDLMIQEKI